MELEERIVSEVHEDDNDEEDLLFGLVHFIQIRYDCIWIYSWI